MKTIVASRNSDLQRDFARDLLRRKDLQLVITDSARELLQRVRQGADLCFVDRLLPDGSGADVAAAIRGDRKLAGVPVVLMTGPSAGADVQGFTEVVELPTPPGALGLLVARLLGVPLRDSDRWAVRVHVYGGEAASLAPPEYLGTSVDLSEMGMLIRATHALPVLQLGAQLALRFALPGQPSELYARATVRRVDEEGFAPAVGIAVSFDELSPPDRAALRRYLTDFLDGWPFRFDVVEHAGAKEVSLAGAITSDTDLGTLAQLMGDGAVDLRLRDLRRFGTDGAHKWMQLVRELGPSVRVRLHECPVGFVQQANQVPNMLDGVEVVSIQAPYACPSCAIEDERVVEVSRLGADRAPPAFTCRSCKGPLRFDDLPEHYFAFLH